MSTPAEIWGYTLSGGLPAEANVAQAYTRSDELHLIHGLRGGLALVVAPTLRTADAIAQEITELAGVVTVTRL